MTDTEEDIWKLTTLDRCDACNAEALVHVKGVSGELYFCGHHYNNADKDKLSAFAFEIIDEREKIYGHK